jgi:hypothetical protein
MANVNSIYSPMRGVTSKNAMAAALSCSAKRSLIVPPVIADGGAAAKPGIGITGQVGLYNKLE